jgi:hypothetical protein
MKAGIYLLIDGCSDTAGRFKPAATRVCNGKDSGKYETQSRERQRQERVNSASHSAAQGGCVEEVGRRNKGKWWQDSIHIDIIVHSATARRWCFRSRVAAKTGEVRRSPVRRRSRPVYFFDALLPLFWPAQ